MARRIRALAWGVLLCGGFATAQEDAPPSEVAAACDRFGRLFLRGEAVELDVTGPPGASIRLEVFRETFSGRERVAEDAFALPEEGRARRTVPVDTAKCPNGLYAVELGGKPALHFGVVPPPP